MAIKKSELYSSLWQSCDELRGGMDASQYKDYVLVLLFMKYVSDKASSQKGYLLDVPKGGGFADMVALKGDKEIGDKINKIIGRLAEANDLKGVIDVADFNDADKLGKGKEMVDRLSNLVSIFDSPSLDFRGNRAEGDDLLGDAYEYLMRHFATESGKSKGQFYTPAEVSRIMPKVIGVGNAKSASQSQHFMAWQCGRHLDNHYLYYWLQSEKSEFERVAIGNTIKTIGLPYFRALRVPLPLLPEQCAIAGALRDVDALLGALTRLIAKKRDLKQAAMQQLLTGQTRLPGFSGEWEAKRLGVLATFFSGGTPSTAVAHYYAGDIPWITSGDLNQGYIHEVRGRISRSGLENSAAKTIEAGTLLIALYGATSGVTAISKIRAAINQAVLAIIPRCDDAQFLYFKIGYLKDWLISTYTQGGQPNLSGDIVKLIEILLPSPIEQTAIATVLSDMDAEIAALEARLAKTCALKQGMMQELLTGRTRLV